MQTCNHLKLLFQAKTYRCPPKAKVTRSNRVGCANKFNSLPGLCRLPCMSVTGRGLFFDTTAALPSYGAGHLKSAIPMNGLRIVPNVPP